jgi:hypothetical protein
MDSQLAYKYVILAMNAVTVFYLVYVQRQLLVPFEDYRGQMTVMSRYFETIRDSLTSKQGRLMSSATVFINFILPLMVCWLPSIAHIVLVRTHVIQDLITMVFFTILWGGLAAMSVLFVSRNRMPLPKRLVRTTSGYLLIILAKIRGAVWSNTANPLPSWAQPKVPTNGDPDDPDTKLYADLDRNAPAYRALADRINQAHTQVVKLSSDELEELYQHGMQVQDSDQTLSLLSLYLMRVDAVGGMKVMGDIFEFKSEEQQRLEYRTFVRTQRVMIGIVYAVLALQLIQQAL